MRALLTALLLSAGTATLAQPVDLLANDEATTAPAASSGGGPKSLLPDDLDMAPAPPIFTPTRPAIRETAQRDADQRDADQADASDAEAEKQELDEPDPLAELAGPTARPDTAGLLNPANGGYGLDLFAGSSGPFLSALLDRIDAPLASRWAQILLQRALLSQAQTPDRIEAADWLASRTGALLSLGSATDAHRLVSAIAIKHYTPALYGVALRSALAAGDPVALCPLSTGASRQIGSPTWQLIDAICLSTLGDDLSATAIFDDMRRRRSIGAFDIGLAERTASAIGGGRRGANPEWSEAGRLTAWRLGLASATGLEIPQELLDSAGLREKAWAARLSGLPLAARARLAPSAAATGAISSDEITRLLAADAQTRTAAERRNSAGGELRAAALANDPAERIAAMRRLWDKAENNDADRLHYGWQVATASAAAGLPISSALAADAAAIAASLNAAGITGAANAWWRVIQQADRSHRAALWAQLVAISDQIPVESSDFERWAGSVTAHRRDLLAAGLNGLGRGNLKARITPVENDWTRALDRAVEAGHAGEVIILSAIGLKGNWSEVPPDYLRRIAAALVAIGRSEEARLIVAEAANRG